MDVFYETPRLPMFMFMEEGNLVRVRTLRYENGKLNGVLADWDVNNIQTDFYGKEHWNDVYEEPFYCLYKGDDGFLYYNGNNLRMWAEAESKKYYYPYKPEDVYDQVIEDSKILGCPIFESIEEARKYVFGICTR